MAAVFRMAVFLLCPLVLPALSPTDDFLRAIGRSLNTGKQDIDLRNYRRFTLRDCCDCCEYYYGPYYAATCRLFCRRLFKVDVTKFNRQYIKMRHNEAEAAFNFLTDLKLDNHRKLVQATQEITDFMRAQVTYFRKQLQDRRYFDRDALRQMTLITYQSADPSDPNHALEFVKISGQLRRLYESGKVCRQNTCFRLPQLEHIFATSSDSNQLLWAWKSWRDAVGPHIRKLYPRFVELLNKGAKDNNFKDAGDFLRQSNYESDELEGTVDRMWHGIKPLYEQLHAYVRRKLKQIYPDAGIREDGPIPAHLLGNMWAQSWEKLYKILAPYPEVASPDITSEMRARNYTARTIYQEAEKFFTSLGFQPMTKEFWDYSMFEQPTDGRGVQCHPLAFDMFKHHDFRIKMCTKVNSWYFTIVHHEMGHIAYFMQYQHQPAIYRQGANSAFHEAVGDVIALSANTPSHLRKIGLLKEKHDPALQRKRDINFLLEQALLKIAFIPYGLIVDKWRWEVFRGNINSSEYNRKWWDMRLRYQGITYPINRTEDDFDPASKFHIAYNIPYIRYFFSFQIQYQFHKALCDAANHLGHLHQCDIYKSRRAGRKLRKMLRFGRKYHWKYLMRRLTRQKTMDNAAMIDYFNPLLVWLKKQNNGHYVGWK